MVTIDADGTIEFAIHLPSADQVMLVAALGGWSERAIPLERDQRGVWRLTLQPGHGVYLFRYHVDSVHWLLDPEAHGTLIAADGFRKSRVWIPPAAQDPDSLAA